MCSPPPRSRSVAILRSPEHSVEKGRRRTSRGRASSLETRSRVRAGLGPQGPNLAEHRHRGPRVGAHPTDGTTKAVAARDRNSGLISTRFFSPSMEDISMPSGTPTTRLFRRPWVTSLSAKPISHEIAPSNCSPATSSPADGTETSHFLRPKSPRAKGRRFPRIGCYCGKQG